MVKCFNTTGYENMLNPVYGDRRVFMPVCGDDTGARSKAVALANALGFDAMDAGALNLARYLEPFAMAWIHLAYAQGLGRDLAFTMARR